MNYLTLSDWFPGEAGSREDVTGTRKQREQSCDKRHRTNVSGQQTENSSFTGQLRKIDNHVINSFDNLLVNLQTVGRYLTSFVLFFGVKRVTFINFE